MTKGDWWYFGWCIVRQAIISVALIIAALAAWRHFSDVCSLIS